MGRSLFIRQFEEGDEQSILELLKRDSADWSWEYKDNPFGRFIGVAEDNGRIIGHMALVPTQMKIDEKTVPASQAVDLIVHPEFRGRGIFLSIGKFLAEETRKKGINFWYGFPNKLAHSGHLKYGWFDVCEVPSLVKFVNSSKVTRVFLCKHKRLKVLNRYKISRNVMIALLQAMLASASFFSNAFNRIDRDYCEGNLEIHKVESLGDKIDDFWKEVSKGYRILVARDKKYLDWRYFKRPNAKYDVLVAEKNRKILGYIIMRSVEKEDLKSGYIVDILASPENKIVIQSLIQEAIAHFKGEYVDKIYCWMLKNNLYYKALKQEGFIQLPGQKHPLIARVNSPRLSKIFVGDCRNWFITIGDSDYI